MSIYYDMKNASTVLKETTMHIIIFIGYIDLEKCGDS